jgi:hypothetical protein
MAPLPAFASTLKQQQVPATAVTYLVVLSSLLCIDKSNLFSGQKESTRQHLRITQQMLAHAKCEHTNVLETTYGCSNRDARAMLQTMRQLDKDGAFMLETFLYHTTDFM